jgi:hypothetical protein
VKVINLLFVVNKKEYSYWLFLVLWVPESNYEWRIMNYEIAYFENVARTKTMKILPMSTVSL